MAKKLFDLLVKTSFLEETFKSCVFLLAACCSQRNTKFRICSAFEIAQPYLTLSICVTISQVHVMPFTVCHMNILRLSV